LTNVSRSYDGPHEDPIATEVEKSHSLISFDFHLINKTHKTHFFISLFLGFSSSSLPWPRLLTYLLNLTTDLQPLLLPILLLPPTMISHLHLTLVGEISTAVMTGISTAVLTVVAEVAEVVTTTVTETSSAVVVLALITVTVAILLLLLRSLGGHLRLIRDAEGVALMDPMTGDC
jgi:hypothetical protein